MGDESHAEKKFKSTFSSPYSLKEDHQKRPLWVCTKGTIILEVSSSPFFKMAKDFCIDIAEPESRLQHFHEYKLTPASLYGAASAGLKPEDIIKYLDRFSKTTVPPDVVDMIQHRTKNAKKLNLYLKDGEMVVEGKDPTDIKLVTAQLRDAVKERLNAKSFTVDNLKVEAVRQKCRDLNYPLNEIYDYKNDISCPDLKIELSPKARLRTYQKISVERLFVDGMARSGIIVLPCGAGKSLTGVYCAVRLGKPCLCFANTTVSVEQWIYQFRTWSTISERRIQGITSETKAHAFNPNADIVVITYSMYGYSGQRSKDSAPIMKNLMNRQWGLVLMDEVHVVPATHFREAVAMTKAHCKVGLTATLLREDEAIQDLEFIIGPKIYEANWQELVQEGYLANVKCFEVQCPMAKDYLREYLKFTLRPYGSFVGDDKHSVQNTLYSANPNKLMACEYLIKYHEAQGDKIIVFSDSLFVLEQVATRLKKAIIKGETGHEERKTVLESFKRAAQGYTVFLSKVGDTSIDLPEATVVIQISSQGGSRRQEAQRLGRVLRPKPTKDEDGNITGGEAYFYSLISQDTTEMYFATKRQQFLVNQGYAFTTLTNSNFPPKDGCEGLYFNNKDIQAELLKLALEAKPEETEKKQPKKKKEYKHNLFKGRFKK